MKARLPLALLALLALGGCATQPGSCNSANADASLGYGVAGGVQRDATFAWAVLAPASVHLDITLAWSVYTNASGWPGVELKALLAGLVAGRVYASTFPQEPKRPTWPSIRFTVISADAFADQCGSADTLTDDVRVQLDVVDEDYDAMLRLKAQVIAALAATPTPSRRDLGGFETFDAATKTHRSVLDYVFHPSTV